MNQYCIVTRSPRTGLSAVIGPYPNEDLALADLKNHPSGWVDILIDPQVLKEGPGATPRGD